jgi:hypothetical protein
MIKILGPIILLGSQNIAFGSRTVLLESFIKGGVFISAQLVFGTISMSNLGDDSLQVSSFSLLGTVRGHPVPSFTWRFGARLGHRYV